jgi:hypothetical protein
MAMTFCFREQQETEGQRPNRKWPVLKKKGVAAIELLQGDVVLDAIWANRGKDGYSPFQREPHRPSNIAIGLMPVSQSSSPL